MLIQKNMALLRGYKTLQSSLLEFNHTTPNIKIVVFSHHHLKDGIYNRVTKKLHLVK
jgi:hypothetical protein